MRSTGSRALRPDRSAMRSQPTTFELDDVARALAGLEAAAAELLDELQAATSKAAQASAAHPPACRALRAYVVNMDSTPVSQISLAAR